MNYTYLVSAIDDGDGGTGVGEFSTKEEAIKCYLAEKAEFPDDAYDIYKVDEDGEWVAEVYPDGNEEEVE